MAAKMGVLLLLVSVAVHAASADKFGPPLLVPSAVIDLDTAPEHRWDAILKDVIALHGWNYTFQPAIDYIEKTIPPKVLAIVENISSSLLQDLPADMLGELQGIERVAQELGYGDRLPMSLLITLNLLYEFSTACTSIVSEDAGGRMWHSRNLDWTFGKYSLRNVTLSLSFQKGGKTLFQGISWAGYIGLLTGMRNSGWSITIDQRSTPDIFSILQALGRIRDHQAVPLGYLVRDTLARVSNFSTAVQVLANTEVTTGVYFIMAGANPAEGAVITRDEKPVAKDVWEIPHGPQPWYILETNYDHDTQPPQEDDRRDLAIHAMNALGQAAVNVTTLFQVMQTPAANHSRGVLNDDTQYTSIMSPSTNFFAAWTWR